MRSLAIAVGLVLLVPGAAHADDLDLRSLPDVTDAMLADSVRDLDLGVGDLDLGVGDLDVEASVTEMEQESTEGSTTVVSLSSDVLFDFGRAEVSDPAAKRLEVLVDDIPKDAEVAIDGHTDNIGSDADNRTLSTRRATAVAAIIRKDRPDLELTTKGHGEADPVASNGSPGNDDPAGRAKNRRVEVRYEE